MLKRILFLIAFVSLLWVSCTKENNAPAIDLQSEFYPLRVGSVYIYDVDSTAYDDFIGQCKGTSVNYKFQLKDTVADTFMDLSGHVNYRIERYRRVTIKDAWRIQQVYSRNKTSRAGEEFINNQRFVRLVFPPSRGAYWNGNSKNTIGKQEYIIEEGILPLMINSLSFDSTVTVKEIEDFNLIHEDLAKSTYAKNIGLVQKVVTSVDKCINTGEFIKGTVYTYKLLSFKIE